MFSPRSWQDLIMVSLPALTEQDVEVFNEAFTGDNITPSTIKTLCSSKSPAGMRQAVEDRLLENGRMTAFAVGLAQGIRKLRTSGVVAERSAKGRVLRAMGLCISEIVGTDLAAPTLAKLHRGLRLPSLLIVLTEVVRDNAFGSEPQRAAASALVAFCGGSPSLWKELAKEIRADARVLKSFLGQVATIGSITDYRTQELTFEAVYRMWKVWKKQDGGPPALPPGTPSEIKKGLASISTKDFEGQLRSMLVSINEKGEADNGGSYDIDPPASFPVEAVHQITDWTGLGCETRIGDAQWLDVGSDSISILVHPTLSSGRFKDVSGDVFVSIPADVIAVSSKVTVGTRSLRIDVPFSLSVDHGLSISIEHLNGIIIEVLEFIMILTAELELKNLARPNVLDVAVQCSALLRVAQAPPRDQPGNGNCILSIRLGGSARVFTRLRQTLAALAATSKKKPGEQLKSPPAKVSVSSHMNVFTSPSGRRQPPASGGQKISPDSLSTPRKRAKIGGGSIITYQSRGSRQVGYKRNLRTKAPAVTPALEDYGGTLPSCKDTVTPDNKNSSSTTQEVSSKRKVIGSTIEVPRAVTAMVRGDDPSSKTSKNIRSIAEGKGDPDAVEASDRDGQTESESESWMETRCRLEVAAAGGGRGKEKENMDMTRHVLNVMDQAQPQAKIRGNEERGISTAKNFKERMLKKVGKSKNWESADDTWGMEDDDDDDDEYVKETPRKKREKPQLKSATRPEKQQGGIGKTGGTPSSKDSFGRPSVRTAARPSSFCRDDKSSPCASQSIEKPRDPKQQVGSEVKVKRTAVDTSTGVASKAKAKITRTSQEGAEITSFGAGTTEKGDVDSSTSRPQKRERPPRRDASVRAMKVFPAGETSSSSDEAELSDGDGFCEVTSECASSKEQGPSEEYVVEQTAEESDAENDDEVRGHESPLSEIDSEGEDGEGQVDIDTSEAREPEGPAVASAPGVFNRSPSKVPERQEISRPGRQREGRNEQLSEGGSEELEEAIASNDDCADDEELTEQTPSGAVRATLGGRVRGEGAQDIDEVAGVESGEEMDEILDDGDGNGSGNRMEESEDHYSMMIAQLCKQVLAHARARDARVKKRKTDAAVEDARQECREYLESTSKTVAGHWRREVEDVVERGLQAEESVAAARERVRALKVEHEAQWKTSIERVQKHASALKHLNNQVRSGQGTFESKLKTEWQADVEAMRLNLQKHREGAVASFSSTVANLEKKAKSGANNDGGRVGGGGGSSSIPSFLSQLTMRTN